MKKQPHSQATPGAPKEGARAPGKVTIHQMPTGVRGLDDILDTVERVRAKRLVIDTLAGSEMALAPGFRLDFRDSLYRMIGALTGAGVTVLGTNEIEDTFNAMPFSHYPTSFLSDDSLRLRCMEIAGQLRKIQFVVKKRGSNQSKDMREHIIPDKGAVVLRPRRTGYAGLTTGVPTWDGQPREVVPGPGAKRKG